MMTGRTTRRVTPRGVRVLLLAGVAVTTVIAACADVSTGPDEAAAIELSPYPSPSVVLGDTLRNVAGVVTPIRAIVRNGRGDIIPDAPIRYLSADFRRDSALVVDTMTGIVRAVRAATTDGRLAARVGASLQVLRTLAVTTRPDSVDRSGQGTISLFTTTLPDTGRIQANSNASPLLNVTVRHRDSVTTAYEGVNAWPVRFEIISPANPTNDTSFAAYLVDDQGRASVFDTTDASGTAGRKVRVRAQRFPSAGITTDTVVVRAIVSYKGVPLKGSPIRLALPVRRGS